MSRTVGEVYIIRETKGVYTSPQRVRVVKKWFTSRTVCELHIITGSVRLSRFENEEYSSCFALWGIHVF